MNLPQKTKSTKMTLSGHGSADRRAGQLFNSWLSWPKPVDHRSFSRIILLLCFLCVIWKKESKKINKHQILNIDRWGQWNFLFSRLLFGLSKLINTSCKKTKSISFFVFQYAYSLDLLMYAYLRSVQKWQQPKNNFSNSILYQAKSLYISRYL